MRYELLKSKIVSAGKEYYETRQISKRLKELLPKHLKVITLGYRKMHKASKAERLALKDPTYVSFLNEIVTMNNLSLESKILWETRLMLLQTWRISDNISGSNEINHSRSQR